LIDMKNKILRVAALILVVVMALSLAACGKQTKKQQYPTPTEKFFVNDFAEIMTAEDIEAIYNKGVALQEKTTAQVVLVTVDSLDGKEIADYALELGREWKLGTEEANNGVVILLSEGDREIYIAVGYGLEGALPDSKTGRIIDTYGLSHFENDNFSAGLASIYDVVVSEIYVEYNVEVENYTPIDQLPQQPNYSTSAVEILVSWIVLIVLVILYIAIFGRRGGLFIFGAPRFFGGFHHHGGFGHRGGFGGGSSGGFGGFRGGGGSFGGGGAGRKF